LLCSDFTGGESPRCVLCKSEKPVSFVDFETLAKHVVIVRAKIKTASPLAYDLYKELSVNGGLILIDETSNVTVGACM